MNELELLRQPREVIRRVMIAPLIPGAAEILEAHGCKVIGTKERPELVLPVGTLQAEVLPRIWHVRYTITLPDGYSFLEMLGRDGVSLLYLPASDVASIPGVEMP